MMTIALDVIAGPHRGQRFTFSSRDRFLVGRSARAHFRLQPAEGKDLYVSRLHFLIEVHPPLCHLLDVGSRNGTYVNGRRVLSSELRDGDEVRAGHTTLRVCLEESPDSTAEWEDDAFQPTLPPIPAPAVPLAPGAGAPCVACGGPIAGSEGPLCRPCHTLAEGQPQSFPDYLLVRELGRGGMGVVHLALDRAARAAVAVKTISPAGVPSPRAVERFLREADILRRLDHKHIVRFRAIGATGGELFLAMDYVTGTDARRLLKGGGPLAVRPAVRLICQLLRALEYAHELGFVHRDIKPANLLLENLPRRKRIKLADFGLARVYQASQLSGLTLPDDIGGTIGFMPPEQITHFRQVRPAADQYSAAATLYTLLTGKGVYNLPRRSAEQLAVILSEAPVPLLERRPELPRGLAHVIHRALARDPARRFPDAAAFRKALLPYGQ